MIDPKSISGAVIADRLGIKRTSNGNYHCFNSAAHNQGDKRPSLSISGNGKGFICFACGIKGNNIELIKQALNIDEKQAFKWLQNEFNAGGNDYPLRKKKAGQVAPERLFIEKNRVERSQAGLNKNLFARELIRLGIPEKHLLKWNVGRGKENRTLFFYQDINGYFCNAKAIVYKPDLHRNKDIPPTYLFKKSDGYKTCLYGENQLKDRTEGLQVILVESEKTAIVGSYAMPDKIWIGTGGTNGLTTEKAEGLKGAKVFILFDADSPGREATKRASKVLNSLRIPCKTIELFEAKSNGYDVADYLIAQLNELKKNIENLPGAARERFEERAGILEHEAGYSKFEAENRAIMEVLKG